jgi:serine/threonine-protein kinase HipA
MSSVASHQLESQFISLSYGRTACWKQQINLPTPQLIESDSLYRMRSKGSASGTRLQMTTSSNTKKECFVYITLPRQTEAVTAAKYELSNPTTNPVGNFFYGRSYLARADAVEIDPLELKFGTTIEATAKLSGMYGALRDASPDYWGRLVIQRALGVASLDEMEYLLQSSDARAGALAFGHSPSPPAPNRKFNTILDLESLQADALAILANEEKKNDDQSADDQLEQAKRLLIGGSSMGGARPKAVVQDKQGLWIAKFNAPKSDRWDNAKVEQAMLKLAKACGITVAHSRVTKIGDRNVLLVKRFDREKVKEGYRRARMISGLTLLRSEDTIEARSRGEWSYLGLVESLRLVSSNPRKDAEELFRRMCFNAAASNLDDHPRNHAAIAMDNDWRLSPAYDLTPSPHVGMERNLAMTAGDQGTRASAENLLSQAARFLIQPAEAKKIVSDISAKVRTQWYTIARREHVTERDCEVIRSAFENEGFSFQSEPEPKTKAPKAKASKRARVTP